MRGLRVSPFMDFSVAVGKRDAAGTVMVAGGQLGELPRPIRAIGVRIKDAVIYAVRMFINEHPTIARSGRSQGFALPGMPNKVQDVRLRPNPSALCTNCLVGEDEAAVDADRLVPFYSRAISELTVIVRTPGFNGPPQLGRDAVRASPRGADRLRQAEHLTRNAVAHGQVGVPIAQFSVHIIPP